MRKPQAAFFFIYPAWLKNLIPFLTEIKFSEN